MNICQAKGCLKEAKKKYCSKSCASRSRPASSFVWTDERKKKLSESIRGTSNPNFGNKWSDEQKQNMSERMAVVMQSSDARHAAGNANRGKKADGEWLKSLRKNCDWTGKHHSEESKEKISAVSKAKFTPEYIQRVREINYARGNWVRPEEKSNCDFYFALANWPNGMNFDKAKMFQSPVKMVRDHRFSRYEGFVLGVFPELVAHPTNCQIISNAENCKKRHKERKFEGTADLLQDLFERISASKHNEKYIALIQRYKSGERYKREDYE